MSLLLGYRRYSTLGVCHSRSAAGYPDGCPARVLPWHSTVFSCVGVLWVRRDGGGAVHEGERIAAFCGCVGAAVGSKVSWSTKWCQSSAVRRLDQN